MNGWVFDIEGDGLYPFVNNIWYIHCKSLDGERELSLHPFRDTAGATRELTEWIHSFDEGAIVAGHNILGYDVWALWKLLGIKPGVGKNGVDTLDGHRVLFVDTLFLSMFLIPDLGGHSLEAWGERLGNNKINYRGELIAAGALEKDSEEEAEWGFYHPLMQTYCNQDVNVNIRLFNELDAVGKQMYKTKWSYTLKGFRASQKSSFLMSAQDFTGVKFDIHKAKSLTYSIKEQIEEIRAEIEPKLPPREMKEGEKDYYRFPSKPYKKDGSLSSNMTKWIEKHGAKLVDERHVEVYGGVFEIIGGTQLNVELRTELKDMENIKEWLLSLGWIPTMYNYKRGVDGKPMRDPLTGKYIETAPKIQEQGKICPNLVELDSDMPKKLVRYLSLRNRLGVLEGWLNNERLAIDKRLPARRSKITPTFRQAHSIVCNVPKAEDGVLLGKEFRSLFVASEGMLFAAADAAAGENRTEASYTLKYDGGAYAKDLLDGDPHLKNAAVFYPKEMAQFDLDEVGLKDNPKVKPLRSKAKSGKYALTFGCSKEKLAATLGLPESSSKVLYDAFWDNNPSLKELKADVEEWWESKGGKKYLPAIDGRILNTRSKHSLLNMLFQSALAISMDYACCLMDSKLGDIHIDEYGRPYYIYKGCIVRRVIYYHDEFIFECDEEIADEIRLLAEKAICKGGELAGVKIPLAGDGKVGKNWKETH